MPLLLRYCCALCFAGCNNGVLLVLLLSVFGLFTYMSLPKTTCSPKSQYLRSALQGASSKAVDAASTAAAAVKSALPGSSNGTSVSLQDFLAGLLQQQEPTPVLLDSAVQAGLNYSSIRHLLQLQQPAFCL